VPNINDISDHLDIAKYFPTVDQAQLAEKVSAKSEFVMPTGHFEYIPFSVGLETSQTFQSLDNFVLARMNGLQCFCYTDVVIITAESLESHTERLREMCQTLRDNNVSALQDRMP